MNENNSIEAIDKTYLTEQTKFRLSEIIGIENYFYQEISQRRTCSKKLNKYVTAFDYIDKVLIVLSAATSGISIISFTSIVGDKILMLAKSKLNSIETLISQALNDMEISHQEFITILKEKNKYERMKDNLRSEKRKIRL